MFAALSWHLVEKRVLKLRKKFSFVAERRLAEESEEAIPATVQS
jgi:peptidoglycan/LPS O-acetylase OafA/YrhL